MELIGMPQKHLLSNRSTGKSSLLEVAGGSCLEVGQEEHAREFCCTFECRKQM